MKLQQNLKTRYKELLYELLITILGCEGIEDFSSSICLPHDVHITASIGIFAPQNFQSFVASSIKILLRFLLSCHLTNNIFEKIIDVYLACNTRLENILSNYFQ